MVNGARERCTLDHATVNCNVLNNLMINGATVPLEMENDQDKFEYIGVGVFKYWIPDSGRPHPGSPVDTSSPDDAPIIIHQQGDGGEWRYFTVSWNLQQCEPGRPCPRPRPTPTPRPNSQKPQLKPQPKLRDCNKEAGLTGNDRIPGRVAVLILRIARQEGVTATALAITRRAETGDPDQTGFGTPAWADNPPNNQNLDTNKRGAEGFDYGPWGLNYYHVENLKTQKGRTYAIPDNAYGTLGAAVFDGDVFANGVLAARFLLAQGGGEYNQVINYPGGKVGSRIRNQRIARYNTLKKPYDDFFNCFRNR